MPLRWNRYASQAAAALNTADHMPRRGSKLHSIHFTAGNRWQRSLSALITSIASAIGEDRNVKLR